MKNHSMVTLLITIIHSKWNILQPGFMFWIQMVDCRTIPSSSDTCQFLFIRTWTRVLWKGNYQFVGVTNRQCNEADPFIIEWLATRCNVNSSWETSQHSLILINYVLCILYDIMFWSWNKLSTLIQFNAWLCCVPVPMNMFLIFFF